MRNIISSIAFLALVLVGCTAHEPQYRIGVSQCLDDAWRQKMNYEMERELLLHPEMKLSRRIAYGSNERQCAQIDSFIAERVDLLIVSPNEAEQVKPAVTRAYRAGIPVIVADRRVTGDEWTAFIGGDNYKVGRLMAQWAEGKVRQKTALQKEPRTKTELQKEHGGHSQTAKPFVILEVAGLPGSTPATLRHKGLMDGLDKSQFTINSVMGSWYEENAYEVVSEYLQTHPLPDAIIAHNDLMAIGASKAVSNFQFTNHNSQLSIPIMGVDGIKPGLQAIVDGTIECSATYASRGDMVIDVAAKILSGEPFIRDTVLETMMVDYDAAYPMLMQVEAITRDLETLHIVHKQTEREWRQIRFVRLVIVLCGVALFAMLISAFVYIVFKQRRLQKEIKTDILPQLEEVQEAIISQRDAAFTERMKQVVEEHLTDPNLNVENLGSMLQLSRTQVYRRVKSVTGKGPLDYIRERRLIKADELLRTTDMTVQQVAIQFCFSSPGYFTKCYKDYFGHLPSER